MDNELSLQIVSDHSSPSPRRQANKKAVPGPTYGEQKVKYPYYDFGPLLSHNAVYNFAVGGRGIGKSYGAKKHVIRNWLRRGEQFIYLRRHKEELKSRDLFFADIQHEFPDWEFRANGNVFEGVSADTEGQSKRPWKPMGYIIALSSAQQNKSIPYPLVTTIIFDEFILEKGLVHYIPDESTVLNNFYSTVDRGQDKTKVLFLANAVSMMNPYFLEYGISPSDSTDIITRSKGFVAVHFPRSEEFAATFYKTRFGEFVKDTDYARYAIGNEFADNHRELVRPKDSRARLRYNLETHYGWISIWYNRPANTYHVSTSIPPGQLSFTLVPEKVNERKMLLMNTDSQIKLLRMSYRTGRMDFESAKAENIFLDLFNKRV